MEDPGGPDLLPGSGEDSKRRKMFCRYVHNPRGRGHSGLNGYVYTHCQTAARSGSDERQNSGVVNFFWGKKRGGGRSPLTMNMIDHIVYVCIPSILLDT